MKNIKLTLSYDGTNYHGFQLQQNADTVQAQLEAALQTVFGEAIRITAAGRTDTGVHALGQVVNFQVNTRIPLARFPYAINANLPADIVVTEAAVVPDHFNARFSSQSKVYRYTIDCAPFPRVLTRHYTYHLRYPLDVQLIQRAATTLVGKHDFYSFMASGSSVKTTERHIMRLDVEEQEQYLIITAEADGFLYNMVRIIVGTLIEVGRGKRSPDLSAVITARNRAAAGWTAPAYGLVMREVKY
ncbi:MAG TPA: tRNA pseudouridine(38-40) synthase TruA [Oscillospiraceae bacterium]|nr:tRNA pseudouridine(38-40) synthase TruA [Oscillospiraceae bacterium]